MRMKIGTRIRLYFACVVAIVLLLGAVGVITMRQTFREIAASVQSGFSASAGVGDLRLVAVQARLKVSAAAASGITSELPGVDELSKRFEQRAQQLTADLAPGIDPAELAKLMARTVGIGRSFVEANAQQRWAEAGQLGPVFENAANALEASLHSAERTEQQWVLQKFSAGAAAMQLRASIFAAALALGTSLLAIFLTLSLQRTLIAPLGVLRESAARIVEHGELGQTIAAAPGDEVGDLAVSFASLLAQMRNIVASLHEAAAVLMRSTDDLKLAATDQDQAITLHAAALQQTQNTANEIRQASAAAAQRAAVVLDVFAKASDVSRTGEESVEHSLNGLGDIGANVALLAERIDLLKERTRQIGGITSTVKDLADQSKILALNAAIEAVRAGEHGKGFGIVAGEIRHLADQSIKSTARIRDNLQEITRAIGDTAALSETGRRRTESGLSDVRAAGETVRQMAAMMTENASGVQQISDTVSQQNAGIAQIFVAVSDLAAIMQNTTRRLKSTSEAIGRMQSVTERISAIVHTYRL